MRTHSATVTTIVASITHRTIGSPCQAFSAVETAGRRGRKDGVALQLDQAEIGLHALDH